MLELGTSSRSNWNRISFLVMIFSGRCKKSSSMYMLLSLSLLQLVPLSTGQEQSFLPSSGDPNDAVKNEGSDMYWCSDSSCRGAISVGRTLVTYSAPTHRHLTFNMNQDIVILGKPVNDGEFWIGKVYRNGRAGLVPKSLIREEKIINQKEKHDMSLDILLLFANEETIVNLEPPKADATVGAENAHADGTQTSQVANEVEAEQEQEYESAEEEHDHEDSEHAHDHGHDSQEVPTPSPTEPGHEVHENETSEEEVVRLEIVPTPPAPAMQTESPPDVVSSSHADNTQAEHLHQEEATVGDKSSEVEDATQAPVDDRSAVEQDELAAIPPPSEEANETLVEETKEPEQETPTAQAEEANEAPLEETHATAETVPGPQAAETIPSTEETSEQPPESQSAVPETASENTTTSHSSVEESMELAREAGSIVTDDLNKDASEIPSEEANDVPQELQPIVSEEPNQVPVQDRNELEQEAQAAVDVDSPADTEANKTPDEDGEEIPEAKSIVAAETSAEEASSVPMEESTELLQETQDVPTANTNQGYLEETSELLQDSQPTVLDTPIEETNHSTEGATEVPQESPLTVSDTPHEEVSQSHFEETREAQAVLDVQTEEANVASIEVTTELPRESQPAFSYAPVNEEKENLFPIPIEQTKETLQPQEPQATVSDTPNEEAHQEPTEDMSAKTNSFVIVVKYLSSTLLSFLPEHLQDTILDVNDALVFTGIIVLLVIGVCVPYFFVETFLSSRPLKKKVVDLNKALWKVSAAYESQQDEFEMFKKKAFAYDECLSKVEKLETQLELKKSIDHKQKLEIQHLKEEGRKRARLETEVNGLVQTTMSDLSKAKEERNKYANAVATLKKSLKDATDELEAVQTELNSKTMDLELLNNTKDFTENKVKVSENEIVELKSKLTSEIHLRREAQDKVDELERVRGSLQEDLSNLRKITLQYEETVNNLTTEISLKENELFALKDSLGDDSPLVEIAEIKAKLSIAEEEAKSLQSRIDSITLENKTLSRYYEESSTSLVTITAEKDEAQKRLHVLESYFKEKEEELRRIVEKQQVEQEIRGKDKNELISIIQEKTSEINDLNERIEQLKLEFEETKNQHRNELRAKDQKNHEQWLALCQSERKVKDAKEEADSYRLKLTQIAKDRGDENDTLMDGEEFFPVVPPPPIDEVPVSYFGLGFEPPAPLDDDEMNGGTSHMSSGGFEPNRPNPVGSISGDSESDDVTDISPIVDHDPGRGRRGDFSDGSASPTGRPLSRDNWMNGTSGRVNYNNNNKKNANNNRTDQRLRHPNQHGPQSASSPINEHSSLC